MKIDNQIIQLKGKGHPDEVADILSERAVSSIIEFNDELYANVNNSYLKAGRFPEFTVGGSMSFDFNKYSKEYRHELENHVSESVKSRFRELFPNTGMSVKFNLNLYPDKRHYATMKGKHDESAFVSSFFPFTDEEKITIMLSDKIESLEYCGLDYTLTVYPKEVLIEVCFFDSEDERNLQGMLNEEIKDFCKSFEWEKDIKINPLGATYNRFGSRVFVNYSGVSGRGNDVYGFRSPQRVSNPSNIRGLDPLSSYRILYKEAIEVAKSNGTEEEPVTVTAFSIAGDTSTNINYINTQ